MKTRTITRTIETTHYTAILANTETMEMKKINGNFIGHHEEKALLKELKRLNNGSDLEVVKVTNIGYTSAIYGMDELTFFEHAELIER